MNRKIALELGGRIFQAEEAAIMEIEAYMAALKQSFGRAEDAAEIIADIEGRMSELFAHKTENMSRPITTADAKEVLAVMGAPSDIGDAPSNADPVPGQKRLYRHPDDQVLAGVCGGLGAYFGIDPIWFRLAFALAIFSFGTGILLYILLIVLVPEATTPAERLMMHGEAVTLANMERRLKEEGKKVEDNLRRRFNIPLSRGLSRILLAGNRMFRFLGWCISLLLFFIGVSLLFLMNSKQVQFELGGLEFRGFEATEALFRSGAEANFFIQALILTLVMPAPVMLFKGLLPVFKRRRTRRYFNTIISGIYAITALVLVVIGLLTAGSYRAKSCANKVMVFPAPDTLFVRSNHLNTLDYPDMSSINTNDSARGVYLHQSALQIETTSDSVLRVKVSTYSMGSNAAVALSLAEELPSAYSYSDGTLLLNNSLYLKPGTPFRGQQHFVTLLVPNGTKIQMDHNAQTLQNHHNNEWKEFWETETP